MFAKDVRTNIKDLQITPDLFKTVACPACFQLYPTINVPDTCTFKAIRGASLCKEDLFRNKTKFLGISDKGELHLKPHRLVSSSLPIKVQIPRATYVTQKLISWVMWFLNKKETEAEINSWATLISQKPSNIIEDIQQTLAWQSLEWLPTNSPNDPPSLHLVFNLFIDWFNPMGNKQAGKKHSMGLIALNCLNLPPMTLNLLANCCIAGITPGAHEPSVTTINHVLSPIVDELLVLNEGIQVCTNNFPNVRLVQIKLLGLVGDVVATHKVAGYASHSTTYFCSYCIRKIKARPALVLDTSRSDREV